MGNQTFDDDSCVSNEFPVFIDRLYLENKYQKTHIQGQKDVNLEGRKVF